MNLLFYTVAGKRSRDIESLAIEFNKKGHTIFLLTQTPHSPVHEFFESKNFNATSFVFQSRFFPLWILRHTLFVMGFCRKNKIDIIYSHLDPCNLISAIAQKLSKTKFVVCRHHAEALEHEGTSRSRLVSKMIYKLAGTILVVSKNAKRYMVDIEKIKPQKITVIPIAYNFSLYEFPAKENLEKLKRTRAKSLTLVTVGRLTHLKRIDRVIKLTYELYREGIDVSLIIVGSGDLFGDLKKIAHDLNIHDRVFFEGFQQDVLPYLLVSDIYVHFSETESSCTTVKEAGLASKPVIVCHGVGDFEEYIADGANGWLVDKENCIHGALQIIRQFRHQPEVLERVGSALNKTILSRFDVSTVMDKYDTLHKSLME
jgi:glycosyltransferase involved in cell wall biosynthesis